MDKRFLGFMMLAMALVMLNGILGVLLNPPRPPAQVQQEQPGDGDEGQVNDKKQPGEKPDAKKAREGEKEPAKVEGAGEKRPAEKAEPEPTEQDFRVTPADLSEEWLTLGSLDPVESNPYRMLVTLTSHGAAVRRIELASRRYREIDDRSGYLGELAAVLPKDGNGAKVQVVGPGTPAAEAGLQPGDVITRLGELEITSPDMLRMVLGESKPNEQIQLTILRAGNQTTLQATLIRRPLAVIRPEIENLRLRDQEPPAGFRDPASLLMTLEQVGDEKLNEVPGEGKGELNGVRMATGNWEVLRSSNPREEAAFRYVTRHGIEIVKRYRLARVPEDERENADYPAFHLEFDIELRNLSDAPLENVSYRLSGPSGLPIEGWWYASKIGRSWSGVGLRDFIRWYEGNPGPAMFGATAIAQEEDESRGSRSVMYLGIDAQYFAAVLLPMKNRLDDQWFRDSRALLVGPKPNPKQDNLPLTNISFQAVSALTTLKPTKSALEQPTVPADELLEHDFTFFAGPKIPDMLVHYHQPEEARYNLGELVYYGWFWWVAVIMLSLLHFFYGIIGNYGIAIILLTVVVRSLMFPLSRKQALNMVKMQELQPEMKRLQEKYKDDLEKRTKAQQDLFRKNNYNPLGGCLLMFLQLPIFIGLYRSLMVDVELRQAPLFSESIRWCSNLGAPDMLFDWSGLMPDFITNGVGIFGLGPYFNILPLVTVGLFLWQQKMFMPPPADEQAAMQQKVMKYMMVFMGFLFYKVAAGLCLYFIASTLWGMAERKYLPKAKPGEAAAAADERTTRRGRLEQRSGKRSSGKQGGGRGASSNGAGRSGSRKKKKQRRR